VFVSTGKVLEKYWKAIGILISHFVGEMPVSDLIFQLDDVDMGLPSPRQRQPCPVIRQPMTPILPVCLSVCLSGSVISVLKCISISVSISLTEMMVDNTIIDVCGA
jgi:hypothetical protein